MIFTFNSDNACCYQVVWISSVDMAVQESHSHSGQLKAVCIFQTFRKVLDFKRTVWLSREYKTSEIYLVAYLYNCLSIFEDH